MSRGCGQSGFVRAKRRVREVVGSREEIMDALMVLRGSGQVLRIEGGGGKDWSGGSPGGRKMSY